MTRDLLTQWLPVIHAALGTLLGLGIAALFFGAAKVTFAGHPGDSWLAKGMFFWGVGLTGLLILLAVYGH
jgi:hypothetical protein